MAQGWEGDKVRLVPLDKARHIENALLWMNDPEATRWLLMGDMPMTRLAEEDWFEKSMRADDAAKFAIETLSGKHIGFCGIEEIEWRHGVATTGTLIGPAEFRGKGFGSDAVRVRTRYAFDVLGLRMLRSQVFDGNPASLKALLRAGYRETGRVPQRYWKRGAYRDIIELACWREPPA